MSDRPDAFAALTAELLRLGGYKFDRWGLWRPTLICWVILFAVGAIDSGWGGAFGAATLALGGTAVGFWFGGRLRR